MTSSLHCPEGHGLVKRQKSLFMYYKAYYTYIPLFTVPYEYYVLLLGIYAWLP